MRRLSLILIPLALLIIGAAWLYASHHRSPVVLAPSPLPIVTPLPTPAQPSPTSTPTFPSVTLMFGGDVMLGRQVEVNMDRYGGAWPLAKLAPTMAAADITIVNLESPFREDAPTTPIDSLVLRGDPKGILSLTNAGVDVVSLSNNHITDMGREGLLQTRDLLNNSGIAFTGGGRTPQEARQPALTAASGPIFAFLSYTYGVNFDSPGVFYNLARISAMQEDVAKAKQQADVIVVLCHCGSEYQAQPNTTQKDFAHAAIDAGATLLIGAHPHIPQPVEKYNNGLIFYSLGNLVFDQEQSGNKNYSALASITLEGKAIKSFSLLPYKILNYGQPTLLENQSENERVWQLFGLPGGKG